jgi:hypothetical protein
MKIRTFILIALISFSSISFAADKKTPAQKQASSASSIQIFGKLDWNDSVADVVKRLNAISEIEQIKMQYGAYMNTGEYKGALTNPEISKIFTEQLREEEAEDAALDHFTERQAKKCIAANGESYLAHSNGVKIVATPVTISGVPFILKIDMALNAGIALINPDGVVGDTNHKYRLPYIIETVELESKSPQLINNIDNIYGILKNKYSALFPNNHVSYTPKNNFSMNLVDHNKTVLESRCDKEYCYITYSVLSGSNRITKYDDAYQKLLADIEKSKSAKHPDSSNEL